MKKLIALSALTVLSATAFAENKTETGINYNEVGVGYVSQDVTTSGTKKIFTGYGINGSALVSENIYLLASYGSTNRTSSDGSKITLGQTSFGLGYRLPVSNDTDFNAAIISSSTTVTSSDSISSYGIALGVSTVAINPDLQTSLKYVYQHSKQGTETGNKNGYDIGLKYKITSSVYIAADYLAVKDLNQYFVGVGYKF